MIAWLDTSREDQQRMREIVRLFIQQESRDELGIGQIRDALSDSLFPGTSTLHTRARYLLLVPWCYLAAQAKGGADLERRVDANERRLIETLKKADATEGLIGRNAGINIKNLPSALYATALRRYGVQLVPNPLMPLEPRTSSRGAGEELTERNPSAWSPTLPPMPPSFPLEAGTGLDLSENEARWLQERILGGTEGTLLHHLVSGDHRPDSESMSAWDDPASASAPPTVRGLLEHARLFSLTINGAALLYNLLLSEEYERRVVGDLHLSSEYYRGALTEWEEDCGKTERELVAWDRNFFWEAVRRVNPNIGPRTRTFVGCWFDAVCRRGVSGTADNADRRGLVRNRELALKGGRSRLINERLLASWSGASGAGSLVYRWPQVRRLVLDIYDGLENDDAAA